MGEGEDREGFGLIRGSERGGKITEGRRASFEEMVILLEVFHFPCKLGELVLRSVHELGLQRARCVTVDLCSCSSQPPDSRLLPCPCPLVPFPGPVTPRVPARHAAPSSQTLADIEGDSRREVDRPGNGGGRRAI